MRVLRFGTSEDRDADISEEQRGSSIAGRMLSEAIGEPVETVVRGGWPDEGFPDRFESAIDECNPDMVFLKVNWFWYGYESLPLRFERLFGRAGKRLGQIGVRVGKNPLFVKSRVFQTGRRLLTLAVRGGATYFTPDQVADCLEACIRRAASREDVILVVRGPEWWEYVPFFTKSMWQREDSRRRLIDRRLKETCQRLHVFYLGREHALSKNELAQRLSAAWFRANSAGHQHMGREEGEAMVAAWRQAHIPVS